MIIYENSSFGFRNLLRVHGSPIYKVTFPTLTSTGFLLVVDYLRREDDKRIIEHPYAVGAFIGFFSFLLTFRLNFAYARYWEGTTAIHLMISKWIDAAMLMAAFHYQADSFNGVSPPAFGNHPAAMATDVQRHRIQIHDKSLEETIERVQTLEQQESTSSNLGAAGSADGGFLGLRKRHKNNNRSQTRVDISTKSKVVAKNINRSPKDHESMGDSSRIPIPLRFQNRFQRALAAAAAECQDRRAFLIKSAAKRSISVVLSRHDVEMPPPSLFFQELAHLVSLLSAVAMSTLRNDIEGCPLSIVEYVPGQPWPTVDPDADSPLTRHEYGGDKSFWQAIYFCLGLSRSERTRTLYNAARPFPVLGGISDGEMEKLDRARGPYAKTALCFMWFQEFISRELLHGSIGNCHAALVSRCYQYASDGCVGYNQARKVAYVPFPFPHGQMTALFSFAIIFIFPVLFQSYVVEVWFACFMNTLTVLCFLGLHEVARELENPFTNIPNDLPLPTFQAQINEALVTMYAGYNPDSWWTIEGPTDV